MMNRVNGWPGRFAVAGLLGALAVEVGAATITRGPYLQLQTTNSVVVRWRTDKPSEGRVFFGESLDKLVSKASSPGIHTEHVVQVKGLKPDTKYYYTVGEVKKSKDLLLQSVEESRYFRTAPAIGSTGFVRVWVLGDSGTADKNALRVRDAFHQFNGEQLVDVLLMLGDNAYENGTDAEYQKAVFETYGGILKNTFLWPTLGNHDGRSASSATQSGVYYDNFTLPTRAQAGGTMSGTEAYYSFDYANAHFVCLDSYDSDRQPGGAMLTWLEQDLAATKQDWIIVYFHHPPYTKANHDSDDPKDSDGAMKQMREMVLPVLEQGGADIVLSGHSHAYERSFLLDGHYGDSKTLRPFMVLDRSNGRPNEGGAYRKGLVGNAPHEGTIYTVAGSSGQTDGGKLNHPVMFMSLNQLGSLVMDFHGRRVDVQFVDDRARVRDHFSIIRETR